MQFNVRKREVSLKIVYYGPALSGKTTNLQSLFETADKLSKGRLVTLETRDDRTIYFDMLPVVISSGSGFRLSFKLYTVPGQAVHNATRRVVLRGVDAVAFIASAERSELDANTESWLNFRENLEANHLDIQDVPTVIQFNKMDLADTVTQEEIDLVADFSTLPTFGAVALERTGCYETLRGLMLSLWDHLARRQSMDERLGIDRPTFEKHVESVFGTGANKHGRSWP